MSYDLAFARRSGAPLTKEDFAEHFAARPRYKLKGSHAFYANQDTGVYFNFEHGAGSHADADRGADEDGDPGGSGTAVASFTINYFRPPFFALEAAPELAAFVGRFDLVVHDQQMDGMGDGDYSDEGFLRGWTTGNRFGHQAIVQEHGELPELRTRPEERLLADWRWNYAREQLQRTVGAKAFVPKILCFEVDGAARSAVIWGDLVPALLPAVDVVLVARQELAPRRFFRRKLDVTVVPWSDLAPLLASFPRAGEPEPHLRLLYDQPPPALVDFVCALQPGGAPVQLPIDRVLSAELVAEARQAAPMEAFTVRPDDQAL
jgi:hypothetical protein